MGQMTFTYNSVTVAIEGKHTLEIKDGVLRFGADFLLIAEPEDDDADFASDCATMLDALSTDYKDFKLSVGAEDILDLGHAANTGFLSRATVRKAGSPHDTARSVLYRFEYAAEREPQNTGRLGRREAAITIGKPRPDLLRTLTFEGTYTALSGTPATALATYTAQVATWITTWLSAITTTGAWQKTGEPRASFDDENKVLRFSITYQEVIFSATPGENTIGVYTIGKFTRVDPSRYGDTIANANSSSRGSDGGGGLGTRFPQRFLVATQTYLNNLGVTNPNTYWTTYIRPWIVSTVNTIFGAGRIIFENVSVPVADVEAKSIDCQATILLAASGLVLEYDERLEQDDNARTIFEHVYDGKKHSYDRIDIGPELRATHTIRQVRLDSKPREPDFLPGAWNLLRNRVAEHREIIDPVTGAVKAIETTHVREYLFVGSIASVGAAGRTSAGPPPNESGEAGGVADGTGGEGGGSKGRPGNAYGGGNRPSDEGEYIIGVG